VDSTNSYALLLISNNNPIEGTAISAGFQAAGRGQIGRSWWGEQGKNVFTSIILKPIHVKASAQWVINQSISLAIVNCLQEWIDAPVSIKWPNDIYVRDKKICGILIQCNLLGKKYSSCHNRNRFKCKSGCFSDNSSQSYFSIVGDRRGM
jgi:BirA family biotin operon repressor/biotin-[acetyl-CoA-carboxylase] ligase